MDMPHAFKPSLLPLAIASFALTALAAPPRAAKDEAEAGWPPISKEELTLKDERGASAMILYREVTTDDVERVETHYYRIKIFTDQGRKYADIEIPYVESVTEVEDIRARTIRPDGTTVNFTGQVFDRTVAKAKKLAFQAKTFTLPEVETGSIIEYSYKTHRRQGATPQAFVTLSYFFTTAGSLPAAHWIIQHDLFTRRARFSIRPLPHARLMWSWRRLPKDQEPVKETDGSVKLEVQNVQPFEEEEYMPPEAELRSRVDFYYALGMMTSTDDLWRQQADARGAGIATFIAKSKAIEREVTRLVAPGDPPETVLRKLYARAQEIRYLSYEPFKTQKEEKREHIKDNRSVEDVLKHGYGSGNEINLLFVALCRVAGLDACPVQVADRRRNFFDRNVPDLAQLNAVVVEVRLASKNLYFDPAVRYCPFNLVPWFETGTEGIRLDPSAKRQATKAQSKSRNGAPRLSSLNPFATVPPPQSSDAILERRATLQLDSDGTLRGKLKVNLTGQQALARRTENGREDEAGRRKELEDEVKGWLPSAATVKLETTRGWESSEEPLSAELSVTIPGLATFTGRRLILPLGVFQSNGRRPFQHAKRLYPTYFPYPFQELDDIVVQLPRGYETESPPAPEKWQPFLGAYERSCEARGGALEVKRRFVMYQYLLALNQYDALREFYGRVRTGDEASVVLRPAGAPEQH